MEIYGVREQDIKSLINAFIITIQEHFDGELEIDLTATSGITSNHYLEWSYDEGKKVTYRIKRRIPFSEN